MIGSHSRRSRVLAAALFLVFVALPSFSQDIHDDREVLITNSAGERLLMHSINEDDDFYLDLRLQPPGGDHTVLVVDGTSVSTTQGSMLLVGFGASPDMNGEGTSVFMGGLSTGGTYEPDSAQAIFRVTRTGALTRIAEAHSGGAGTAIGSDTICHFEPMPAINENGQIAFGFNSDIAGGVTIPVYSDCEDLYADEAGVDERKGVARWTSPSTLIKYFQSGDTISVGTPYRASTATYYITKTGFTHMGDKVFNASGHAVAEALLDDDFTVRAYTPVSPDSDSTTEDPDLNGSGRDYDDDRMGLFYLRGANDYLLIAASGPDSIFQEVEAPVLNDAGQVLFKGLEQTSAVSSAVCGYDRGDNWPYYCDETASSLNLWTVAGGRVAIADTETGTGTPSSPPNSTGVFQGFSPHYDINNDGQVLFSAGLLIDGEEDNGDSDYGDYRTVILRQANGTFVEIARTVAAATDDTGGPFDSSVDGFNFEKIGSATVLTESGNAYFVAEIDDALPDNPCTPEANDPWIPDDDQVTAVIGWSPVTGLRVAYREGGLYNGQRIISIEPPMPHLRDQSDGSNRLFVKIYVDADNDCETGEDEGDTSFVVGAPAGPDAPAEVAVIPAVGLRGLLLLGALLAAAALFLLRINA